MGVEIGFRALLLCLCARQLVPSSQEAVLNEHLVALSTDDPSGVAAVLVAGRHRSNDHSNYPFTSGQRVSPACSAAGRAKRCRELLVVDSSETNTYIVLAPLQNAVGLMELRYNGVELSRIRDFAISLTDEFQIDNCVPLDIIVFEGKLRVLCLESLQRLRSCDIQLHPTDISRSIFKHCISLHTFNPITEDDYRYISNFVLYPSLREVVFILRGGIYGIRYERFNVHEFFPLSDTTCSRLEYAGDDVFYAYCASEVRVFNTDTSSVSDTGHLIPFVCPQTGETLYKVQRTDRDTIVRYNDISNYRTAGVNFTTGKCYDTDTFLLIDALKGTKVLRPSSGSFLLISNSSRDKNLVVNGSYSAIFRDNPSEVLLYDPSFSLAVDLSAETIVAVAVIANLTIELDTSSVSTMMASPTSTALPTKKPPKGSLWYTQGAGIVIWVVLGLLFLAAVIIATTIFLLVGNRYSQSRRARYEAGSTQDPTPLDDRGNRSTPEGGAAIGEDARGGSSARNPGLASSGASSSSVNSADPSVAGTRNSTIDGMSGEEEDDDDTLVRPQAATQDHLTNSDLVIQQ